MDEVQNHVLSIKFQRLSLSHWQSIRRLSAKNIYIYHLNPSRSPCFMPNGLIGKEQRFLLVCGLQILNESGDTGFSFAFGKIFIVAIY